MIETNGIRLHVAEQVKAARHPLHGFPECWYSWRHQLGRWRGWVPCGGTRLARLWAKRRPEEVEKYTLLHYIATSWVWSTPSVSNKRSLPATMWGRRWLGKQHCCARTASGRDCSRPAVPAAGVWRLGAANDADPRNENAVFYNSTSRPEAEAALGRDMRRAFRSQFYSLSGDMPASAGGGFAAGMVPGGFFLDRSGVPAAWITESDVDVYVAEFTRSEFRGALNWWRNIDRSWELMAAFDGAA